MVIHQSRYIQAAQQLLRLAAGVLGQRSGPVDAIRAELEELAGQVGMDLGLAFRLTPESLTLLVSPPGAADPLRGWLVAEIFYLNARLAERDGATDLARESDARALLLYERVEPTTVQGLDMPDPATRVAELRHRLERGD